MRIQTLTFNFPFHAGNIRAFRSAIIDTIGWQSHLFHNHDNSTGQPHYHWGYPLVQYAVRRGKAAIIGIGPGAKALEQELIPKMPDSLWMLDQKYAINRYQMDVLDHQWAITDVPVQYGIQGWLALNHINFKAWKATENDLARQAILSKALTGHLRSIVKQVSQFPANLIKAEVLQVDNQKRIEWHQIPLVRFNVIFEANVLLPKGIGIGRCAAFGFGELLPIDQYKKWQARFPKKMYV